MGVHRPGPRRIAQITIVGITLLKASRLMAAAHHDVAGLANVEACSSCHAATEVRGAGRPRWGSAAAPAFVAYQGQSAVAPFGPGPVPPGPTSLACLSCHDGTVARQERLGFSGDRWHVDPDLSDAHPIGLVYDSALAASRRDLRDPAVHPSGLGGTIAQDMLVAGRIECTSCHGVHAGTDAPHLLIKSNEGSALCLTCHDK